jgi:hypothetical protein
MADPAPKRLYTTLVLFGKETKQTVVQPDTFRRLTDAIAGLLSLACPDLKARGWVAGEKAKHVGPRRGPWSPKLRDQYVESFARGRFENVELFDPAWSSDRAPDAYGAVYKRWGYGQGGQRVERTEIGAENIVVALRDDFVEHALERVKSAAKALIPTTGAFYGFMESPVPWDQDIGDGVYEDMIDLRFHNRVANDYRNGEHRMSDGVPRLYRGNILSRSQLAKHDPADLKKVPGVVAVEQWPGGLTYVELAKEPKYGSKPPRRFADFIRFIPQD